ncbi:hypothetical protein SMICM304S_06897 [Streptomyces microflavus]
MSAPIRSVSRRSAPERSAAIRQAPRRVAPRELRAAQPGAEEVGAPVVLLLAGDGGAGELTGAQEVGVHLRAEGRHVDGEEGLGAAPGQCVEPVVGAAQLAVGRLRRRQVQGLGRVPQQLVQLPHHREDLVHRAGGTRLLAPVRPPKVTWETFWRAPKQSNTVQPW